MGIVDEDIARVREASDIVAIVSRHLALKKQGRRFFGLCPFHAENTPSFSVNPELGVYYCFGCQAKGDAITFVREMEHLDFVAAVEDLANRAGITLRYTDRDEGAGRRRRRELVEAVSAAVEWYHRRLLESPDAGPARSYLRSRGLDGDIVRRYQLGWAPEGWDELVRALDVPGDQLIEVGLAFRNRRGRLTDQLRGRVLFPIFNAQGDPVAFGGRILPGGEGPKYKNSPETPIYSKSKVLYALNWHKSRIVEQGEVVVCEGYTDVIGFAQAGVERAVATCGTSLTEEHVRLLKRFANRVVLAFDADEAGEAAAERFYEWERAYEIEVAVADLPAGVDPGELAQRDPDRLRAAVEDATSFLAFRVDRVLAGASLDTPEHRARAAEHAMGVVAEHPSELVRDQYLMEVADRCRVDPAHLRALARSRSGPSSIRTSSRPRRGPERPAAEAEGRGASGRRERVGDRRTELEALRVAVHHPAEVAELLDEVLFADDVALTAFRSLVQAHTFHQALELADPTAAEMLQQLAVEEPDAEPHDVVVRLIDEAVTREVAMVEVEARRADDPLRYAADVAEAKLQVERLRESATALDAAGQLLGWLQERAGERQDGAP